VEREVDGEGKGRTEGAAGKREWIWEREEGWRVERGRASDGASERRNTSFSMT